MSNVNLQSEAIQGEVIEGGAGAMSQTALATVLQSELDSQISTAKRFPRSAHQAKALAMTMATLDPETAAGCFYKLPRKENGGTKYIEGPSIRLAEIFASAWGNLRYGARIIAEDSRFVVAQGFAHDLQTNTGMTTEIRRRITRKNGEKFSDDMIGVTANAAAAIARRNALLGVIPRVYINQVYEAAKKVAVGDAKTLVQRRSDLLTYLQSKMAIPLDRILGLVERKAIEDIDLNDMETLHGAATAVKEGMTGIDEAFPPVGPAAKEPSTPPADASAALAASLKKTPHSKPEAAATSADKVEGVDDGDTQVIPGGAGDDNIQSMPQEPSVQKEQPVDKEVAAPTSWADFTNRVESIAQDKQKQPADANRLLNLLAVSKGWMGKKAAKADPAVMRDWLQALSEDRMDWITGAVSPKPEST